MTDQSSSQLLISPEPVAEPATYPLSFAQRRLWFLDRLEPGKSVYNISEAWRLSGPLDRAALARSVNEIVRRHETLRTTFAEVDGSPLQVVAPSLALEIPLEDVSGLPAAEREREARHLISDRANQPFDLEHGPLIRVALIRIAPTDHVFMVGMHHIISEGGWSMGVLVRELNELYNAALAGRGATLPELEIQYGDYALWQQDWLQGQVREQLLEYWTTALKGAPTLLELPSDSVRPSQQSYAGSKESYLFPAALKNALNHFSKAEGATLFMTVLTAFAALLARYSGQDDLLIGVPVSGRGSPETHNLIGFFANTLAMRVDLTGNPTFREAVQRVRQSSLGRYDYEDLPFELLVDALKPERSLAYSPILQVMFAYQNAPREDLQLPGIAASAFEIETRCSMFDLTLYLWERPEGLAAGLEYSTDLFERATIQRLLEHLEVLLAAAVANPDAAVGELPLSPESEVQRITKEWNATQAEYPADLPLHRLIEAQAAATPNAIAVRFENESLSYAELNSRANQVARYLESKGAGPGGLVAIFLERSLEMVVGLLAILKTGAAYLPLDPIYPSERLAFMLKDSEASILLTQESLAASIAGLQGQIVQIDGDGQRISRENAENLAASVGPEARMYSIYTSGSTGLPKGVQISHRNAVNLLYSFVGSLSATREDVWVAVTTLSFDIAGLEIWMPLLVGAQLVVASRNTTMDGAELAEELSRTGATILQATPSTWQLLLESGWQGSSGLTALCGGEAFPSDLARQLQSRVKALWNVYGPTETTIWSSTYRVQQGDGRIPIGRPLANTQFYILDERGKLAAQGVPGELYIGGDGVAMGYWHRPELNAQKFVADAFRGGDARMYRTGDRVRYRADGNVEFLGRFDHQIKLRGFRIELGEITEGLLAHPQIKDAVVILREDQPGDKRLVGYLVCSSAEAPAVAAIREHLKAKLPDYMIPAQFVFMETLPRLANGKLNRHVLPAPESTDLGGSDRFVAPRNSTEEQLVAIWEQLLSQRPIGIRDNFFDLGGHSLLLIRLIVQIEKAFGQRLPVATVMGSPTVEALASALSGKQPSGAVCRVIPLKPQGTRPPFICLGATPLFLPLARLLGPEQPFCGLDLTQLQQVDLPKPCRLEDLGAYVVEAIREYQPQGPYNIGGWCLYGVLAYEAARQLLAQGHEVELLTLFDSPNVAYGRGLSSVSLFEMKMQKWMFHISTLVNSNPAEMWRYSRHLLMVARSKLARRRERAAIETGIREEDLRMLDLDPILYYAAINYVPPPYSGRVLMVQAVEKPSGKHWQIEQQWSKPVLGPSVVHTVAGGHDGMFKYPFVEPLAAKVKATFEEAFAPRGNSSSHGFRMLQSAVHESLQGQEKMSQEPSVQ